MTKPLFDQEFKTAVEAMQGRMEAGLTKTDLARLGRRDVYPFSRAFRLRTGVPPHQYLIWMRLKRARGLIEGTQMPLSQIAYACGYSSQPYMRTAFRVAFGTTPGAMRTAKGTLPA